MRLSDYRTMVPPVDEFNARYPSFCVARHMYIWCVCT
jgi:hypothetical protein